MDVNQIIIVYRKSPLAQSESRSLGADEGSCDRFGDALGTEPRAGADWYKAKPTVAIRWESVMLGEAG